MSDSVHEVTSGGVQEAGEPVPALYATKELAFAAWKKALDAFLDTQPESSQSTWDEPIADKFLITIQGADGGHRLAEPRWSVSAKVHVTIDQAAAA